MNEHVIIAGVAQYVGLEKCGIIRGAILDIAIIDIFGDILCQAKTKSGYLININYTSIYSVYKDWKFLRIEYKR